MQSTRLILLALLFAALPLTAVAAGDPAAGKQKAASCASCHGADGNSVNPAWPRLAGQHANYLVKQLSEYKSGERQNSIMAGMAAGLSEDDMADIAAFYARQTVKAEGEPEGDLALGERIYAAGIPERNVAACAACHGPEGRGNPLAKFPSLAGQHAAYTVSTLRAFAEGQRANDRAAMMREVAAELTEAEMKAVAAYTESLR